VNLTAHRRGIDILGASSSRAILIRVKNAKEVAAKQSALASIASSLVPSTVEARVYDEMAARFRSDLASNGVDADVSVIADASASAAGDDDRRALLKGVAIGAGGAGIVWLVGRFVFTRFFGGR